MDKKIVCFFYYLYFLGMSSSIPQLLTQQEQNEAQARRLAKQRLLEKRNDADRQVSDRLDREYAIRASNNAALLAAFGSYPFFYLISSYIEEKDVLFWLSFLLAVAFAILLQFAKYRFRKNNGYVDRGKRFVLVGLTMLGSLFYWVTTQVVMSIILGVGKAYAAPNWPVIIFLLAMAIACFFSVLAWWQALFMGRMNEGDE